MSYFMNPRLAAFDALYDIIYNDAYSNLKVNNILSEVDKRNKGFVSALIYGVIERKITLEYIVSQYLHSRTKPKVKLILIMGAYQIYFMDKIPPSAVINESVELSKTVGVSYYSKLINAVLHKIDIQRIDIDSIEDLSIRYSCPPNLIKMWQKAYGEEKTVAILDSSNKRPPVYFIPNRTYVDAQELSYELSCCNIENEILGDVVRTSSAFSLHSCKAFDDGLFYIEDLSSYHCAKRLGAQPGETIIDVCSAPGGKAFTIANDMKNEGKLLAFDLYEHRAKLIEDSCARLGIKIIETAVNDATVYNPEIPIADRVLCDVPCSGFGIIRRKPEIKYKNLDSIKELPKIQSKILEISSLYLKVGGTLIYSTCTLNKKENENVVSDFLQSHTEFVLIEQKTTFPSNDGGDGFFYAVIERKYDGH